MFLRKLPRKYGDVSTFEPRVDYRQINVKHEFRKVRNDKLYILLLIHDNEKLTACHAECQDLMFVIFFFLLRDQHDVLEQENSCLS